MTEEQAEEVIELLRSIHLELIKIGSAVSRAETQQLKSVGSLGALEEMAKRVAPLLGGD